jgi:glutathione S-transferase
MPKLTLVSHALCPYVQRAAIALYEKGVAFERVDVDLDNKPDWFKAISPLGKVPLLKVGDAVIFESAVIVEYLEETQPNPLHPSDPLQRAQHRAWMEFGSAILADIWGFYTASDETVLQAKARALTDKFARLEQHLGAQSDFAAPYFEGARFSLVDAVFAPVFRYFDLFDRIGAFGILDGKPKLAAWREALAQRPSVIRAVAPDFQERLRGFVIARNARLSQMIQKQAA